MDKINAIITGVAGYVPDYVLNNEELSRIVDTNDEWITTRTGIKERRILTEEDGRRPRQHRRGYRCHHHSRLYPPLNSVYSAG